MNSKIYGNEMHPVVVVGPEYPNDVELELKNAIENLYGLRNYKPFTSYKLALKYLTRHKGISQLNPMVIAIYTKGTEDDIASFFDDIVNTSTNRYLAISDEADLVYLLNQDLSLNNDDILYLYKTSQAIKEQELCHISGMPLADRDDVENLCTQREQ